MFVETRNCKHEILTETKLKTTYVYKLESRLCRIVHVCAPFDYTSSATALWKLSFPRQPTRSIQHAHASKHQKFLRARNCWYEEAVSACRFHNHALFCRHQRQLRCTRLTMHVVQEARVTLKVPSKRYVGWRFRGRCRASLLTSKNLKHRILSSHSKNVTFSIWANTVAMTNLNMLIIRTSTYYKNRPQPTLYPSSQENTMVSWISRNPSPGSNLTGNCSAMRLPSPFFAPTPVCDFSTVANFPVALREPSNWQ